MTATISLALALTTWLSTPVSLDKDSITAAEARVQGGAPGRRFRARRRHRNQP